jgi:hypothetical protein
MLMTSLLALFLGDQLAIKLYLGPGLSYLAALKRFFFPITEFFYITNVLLFLFHDVNAFRRKCYTMLEWGYRFEGLEVWAKTGFSCFWLPIFHQVLRWSLHRLH